MARAWPKTSRQLATVRDSNVIALHDRRQRAARRPGAKRDERAAQLVHWSPGFKPQRGEDIDATIVLTWKLHLSGYYDFDEAGQRHHQLIEQRDGRPVR